MQLIMQSAWQTVKTNNVNVEFSAYFQDENGEKIQKIEEHIDKKQYLYVDVSVKNEGYFNGEIKIADENFNIKSDEEKSNSSSLFFSHLSFFRQC